MRPSVDHTPRLDGRVVVITGGTRGLGLATAQTILRGGGSVVVASRSSEGVQRALDGLSEAGGHVAGTACDVADMRQVSNLLSFAIEHFGRLDVWINNAGLSAPYGPTAHVPSQLFEAAVNTNVLGTYHGSVVALRYFLPRHSGKVINLLGRGDKQPVPLQNAYAASKAWVRNFTLALAREYRGSGVGIFAFNPGLMYTDLIERAEAIAGFEQRLRPLATVMRIWGQSPEIAAARLARLASSETDGKTGLEVRLLTPREMATGVARDVFNRVRGRASRTPELHARSVPAALE